MALEKEMERLVIAVFGMTIPGMVPSGVSRAEEAASFTHHHSNHLMLTAEGRGAGGTVNYTGSGTIKDASPSFNTVSNDQDNGYGIRGSIKLAKKGERNANITFSGVIVGTGYEPKNETLEVGGAIKLRF